MNRRSKRGVFFVFSGRKADAVHLLSSGNNQHRPVADARMAPSWLKKSGVGVATEIVRLVKLTRTYEMVADMMKKDDDSVEMQRLSDTL